MPVPIPAWLERWTAGALPIRELAADRLVLPSGRLIACDPLGFLDDARPFARKLTAGRHKVVLGIVADHVAFASIRFGRARVARWEVALRPDEHSEGGVFGFGVDSGIGCFVDADAATKLLAEAKERNARIVAALRREGVDPNDVLAWHEAFQTKREKEGPGILGGIMPAVRAKGWGSLVLDEESGGNLVAFTTGIGDGVYASYWGLDAKGRPMALVTDFGLLDEEEEEDEERETHDERPDELEADDDLDLAELERWLTRRAPVAETPPATSPLLPRAEQILQRWEHAGRLQLEDDCDRRMLAEALLEKLVALEGHRHVGSHLAEWLMERPEVADVFASDDELEADLRAASR